MKKGLKILLWVLGVTVGLAVVAALAAAPVAKRYVNGHGEQLVGRRVQVDQLRLNVFTGHLALRGFDLYEDDGQQVFAHFDTLDVKAHLLRLLGKTVYLKHITLSGLHANLVKEGEQFNFQSLIDHFSSADTAEAEKDTTPSDWVIKLYNIRLSHAGVNYTDLANAKQWALPDINLKVPGFVIGGQESTEGGLNIGFDRGGRLNVDANYDAAGNSFRVEARLYEFALDNLTSLASDFVNIDRLDGSIQLSLKAEGGLDDALAAKIDGLVRIDSLDVLRDEQSLASARALAVQIGELNLAQNRFDIDGLMVDGLTSRFDQWSDHNTLTDLLGTGDAEGATEAADTAGSAPDSTPSKPLHLRVGRLTIRDVNLTYADHTLPDPFEFPVTGIEVEATELTTSGDNNARLRATLPGGGHLAVRWNGNIDNWKQHQDLFLTVRGLDMRQLSPWLVAYTGQPIEEGVFSLTSRNAIHQSQLSGENTLDIFKIRVGSRRKDVEPEMKLPLKAALYVLKDKDEKILLDVPVKGNIDSPEFNYMKLVWKTLGNLIVKVATSPARAVAGALGMSGDTGLDFIAVDTAQRSLTSQQYHTLGQLAEIAKYDSLMVLRLSLEMPQADSADMRRSHLVDMVRQYLVDQGVREEQLVVGISDSLGRRSGFAVSSELPLLTEE